MTNFSKDLQAALYTGQSAPAIDCGEPVAATELWSLTGQFAGGLHARNVQRGETVAIQLSAPLEYLVAVYGTLRNGSVPVIVPTAFDADETTAALDAVEATALVSDDSQATYLLTKVDPLRLLIAHDVDRAPLGVAFEDVLVGEGLSPGGSRTGVDVVRRADDDLALIAFLGSADLTGSTTPGIDADADHPPAVTFTHAGVRSAVDAGGVAPLGAAVERHLGTYRLDDPIGLLYGATSTIVHGGCFCPLASWDVTVALGRLAEVDRAYVSPSQYEDLVEVADELRRRSVDRPESGGVDTSQVVAAAVTERIAETVLVVDPTRVAADAPAGEVRRVCATPATGITHVRSPQDVEAGRLGQPVGTVDATVIGDRTGELAIASAAATSYLHPRRTAALVRETDDRRWSKTGATVRLDGGTIAFERTDESE